MKPILITTLVSLAAAGAVCAQTSPGSMPGSTPAPDTLPPPVTQPDAVRHAGGSDAERLRAPARGDNERTEARSRSEMASCTAGPRESWAECARGAFGGRAEERESGAGREGSVTAPRERGMKTPR
ncbi:hypothetical protein [Caldimonas brevitalea]|uniref:Uncharacterized protein n=1 Tax=Caldimonas brevitalea TaxID=413882 RepID=A0A0G3BT90_9BURK|nr:hypothetical protein [Caldimonas brevitalea]AKJ30586.1 hypothetical protein AAW51_3895 [Caldimonas brevitalea]